MKTIGLRTLYKEASHLTEEVLVLQDRRVIGSFKPFINDLEDVAMDESAKKAIEPDNVKKEPRGRLSKGLGDLPGDPKPTIQRDPYVEFKPAPKPGRAGRTATPSSPSKPKPANSTAKSWSRRWRGCRRVATRWTR